MFIKLFLILSLIFTSSNAFGYNPILNTTLKQVKSTCKDLIYSQIEPEEQRYLYRSLQCGKKLSKRNKFIYFTFNSKNKLVEIEFVDNFNDLKSSKKALNQFLNKFSKKAEPFINCSQKFFGICYKYTWELKHNFITMNFSSFPNSNNFEIYIRWHK